MGETPIAQAVPLFEVKEPHLAADDGKGDARREEADQGDEDPALGAVPEVDQVAAEAVGALELPDAAEPDRVLDGVVQPVDRGKVVCARVDAKTRKRFM